MKSQRITISLNDSQLALLAKLMNEDHQTNRTTYFVYLLAQEEKNRNKRPAGRPRKEEQEEQDEMPDENAPRNKQVPKNLEAYVFPLNVGKPVNDYDIVMLEEKKKMHDAQSGK